jgi:zinc protease
MIYSLLFACLLKQPEVQTAQSEKEPELSADVPNVPELMKFTPPTPVVSTLDNGSSLWLVENHELPLVVLKIVLPGGYGSEIDGDWGRAILASQMITEGAGERSAQQTSSDLHMLASSVGVSTYSSNTVVSVFMHRDRIEDVLSIVSDVVYRPTFAEEDWNRVLERHSNGVLQSRLDPRSVGSEYTGYFLYGTGHPLGIPSDGTPDTLAKLDREKVQQWHQSRLFGEQVTFALVGDITASEANTVLSTHFPSWDGQRPAVIDNPVIDDSNNGKIIVLDMPGAQQTTIRVLSSAFPQGDTATESADLAAKIMGGSFTSRLNSLLREEKGYTYGIGCWFSSTSFGDRFALSTSVVSKHTSESLQDIYTTLHDAKNGFSEQELSKAKVLDRTDRIENVENRGSIAAQMTSSIINGFDPEHQVQVVDKIAGISVDDMNNASQYMQPERGIILLIGDVSVISESLKNAGFEFTVMELPN